MVSVFSCLRVNANVSVATLLRRASSCVHLHRRHLPFAGQCHRNNPRLYASAEGVNQLVDRPKIILGIESSCDDTGVAIVSSDGQVLGESLAGQVDIHAPWGGVVPNLAQEAHKAAIDRVVAEALAAAKLEPSQLDAIAVTIGPGLSMCLRVGVSKARALAAQYQLPLVHVHHMEAHALVPRLAAACPQPPKFPFLCLLVSGGHNLLLLVRGVGSYVQLGTTIDDALGEAYDKVARMLGLELRPHGGAALELLARSGDPKRYPFKRPMLAHRNCDFSYAGLKTAVRLAIEKEVGDVTSPSMLQVRADIAASFQFVAVQHLEERTRRAVEWAREMEPGSEELVVAGGVAANAYVRERIEAVAQDSGLRLVVPPPRWCTDNGVMVAWAGMERLMLGLTEPPPSTVTEGEWLDVRPRWPLTDERHPASITAAKGMRLKRLHTSLTQLTQLQSSSV